MLIILLNPYWKLCYEKGYKKHAVSIEKVMRDIWLMMCQFDFNGSKLTEALKRTFARRKTAFPKDKKLFAEEIYDEKSDRQILWKSFLNKEDIKHAPQKLSTTVKEIEKFLINPLGTIKKEQKFNGIWKAPGPWDN